MSNTEQHDELDLGALDNLEIPDTDITYQQPDDDDGCAGGACKI